MICVLSVPGSRILHAIDIYGTELCAHGVLRTFDSCLAIGTERYSCTSWICNCAKMVSNKPALVCGYGRGGAESHNVRECAGQGDWTPAPPKYSASTMACNWRWSDRCCRFWRYRLVWHWSRVDTLRPGRNGVFLLALGVGDVVLPNQGAQRKYFVADRFQRQVAWK
jgi:hypothetical protein